MLSVWLKFGATDNNFSPLQILLYEYPIYVWLKQTKLIKFINNSSQWIETYGRLKLIYTMRYFEKVSIDKIRFVGTGIHIEAAKN